MMGAKMIAPMIALASSLMVFSVVVFSMFAQGAAFVVVHVNLQGKKPGPRGAGFNLGQLCYCATFDVAITTLRKKRNVRIAKAVRQHHRLGSAVSDEQRIRVDR